MYRDFIVYMLALLNYLISNSLQIFLNIWIDKDTVMDSMFVPHPLNLYDEILTLNIRTLDRDSFGSQLGHEGGAPVNGLDLDSSVVHLFSYFSINFCLCLYFFSLSLIYSIISFP